MTRLNDEDREMVFRSAETLTGSCQDVKFRRDILVTNVERRMEELNIKSLPEYLDKANGDVREKAELISRLTIHTTSWFREEPHYELLKRTLSKWKVSENKRPFFAWSVASSTGEEGYGMGLILERHRRSNPDFDYRLFFTDIDPLSVARAERALYWVGDLERIPQDYRSLIRIGSGKAANWMTVDPEIRKRSTFRLNDLSRMNAEPHRERLDFVLCRNVLIYFSSEAVNRIVQMLMITLTQHGVICLGHSEALNAVPVGFFSLGNAAYKRISKKQLQGHPLIPLGIKQAEVRRKVLTIDDSVVIRKTISKILTTAGYDVTEAESGPAAREILRSARFDLITLDLMMPEEDGLDWLEKERKRGLETPVLIVTDADPKNSTVLIQSLEKGAQDYFLKSNFMKDPASLVSIIEGLVSKKSVKRTVAKLLPNSVERPEVIVIGASTGGPEALCRLLKDCPSGCPPIVVVLHISNVFAKPFAERLACVSRLPLGNSEEGVPLENGKLYMAFGSYHIGIHKKADALQLDVQVSSLINGHMPSVDYLFQTVVFSRTRALAMLLTGMGKDGAKGLSEIKQMSKGYCAIQDEASSVVYGMPRVAEELGAYHFQGNIEELRSIFLLACGVARTNRIEGKVA